jgi:AAA domain
MFEPYFGLRAAPFQLSPDPSFYYDSREHAAALAYLKFGIYQREGFIVITGEIGAGKTTLVRTLLQSLNPAEICAAQVVSTQLDSADLLRAICTAYGIAPQGDSKAQMISTLEAFFTAVAAGGRRALLVIDEAQNLGMKEVEELRMLSNFQLGSHALVQSFLVGQPEPPGPAQRARDPGLHRAPAAPGGLAGQPALCARGFRPHPRVHRRHPAPHQSAVQPAAAGHFPGRAARDQRAGRGPDLP